MKVSWSRAVLAALQPLLTDVFRGALAAGSAARASRERRPLHRTGSACGWLRRLVKVSLSREVLAAFETVLNDMVGGALAAGSAARASRERQPLHRPGSAFGRLTRLAKVPLSCEETGSAHA